MKKVLFTFGFLLALCLGVNAQSCCANKSSCTMKAEKAASADATIEKRVDDAGTIAYVRKESDAQGNVKFVSVKFDEGTNTFVNVAPKSATAQAGLVKKTTTTKACAGEGEAKAGCCKGGGAAKTCDKTATAQ